MARKLGADCDDNVAKGCGAKAWPRIDYSENARRRTFPSRILGFNKN
jgi:hypothetical protein